MVCCIAGSCWSNDASMVVEIAAEDFRQAFLSHKLANSGCTRK